MLRILNSEEGSLEEAEKTEVGEGAFPLLRLQNKLIIDNFLLEQSPLLHWRRAPTSTSKLPWHGNVRVDPRSWR
ncbi:hypothetical protein NDU88_000284 [Pleurodeles waltl]|uniref:Uncharacterized protein n=1 Tax=Pleurodeles waltl TaxID=8319 RepID=A0AAV7SW35_PLEWA|nr:hypothetical protein NDU88_000284 [Pleurodeles waltl]